MNKLEIDQKLMRLNFDRNQRTKNKNSRSKIQKTINKIISITLKKYEQKNHAKYLLSRTQINR